jgi:hypothetical protein
MQLRKQRITLALVIVISCFFPGQTQSETGTGLEGVISVDPAQPGPIREGVPSSAPLAGAAFVVANEKGAVTSFATDDQGRFRISLTPGHYTVSMQKKERGLRHCGPFDVDVVAGQMTRVEWKCDTGMR